MHIQVSRRRIRGSHQWSVSARLALRGALDELTRQHRCRWHCYPRTRHGPKLRMLSGGSVDLPLERGHGCDLFLNALSPL